MGADQRAQRFPVLRVAGEPECLLDRTAFGEQSRGLAGEGLQFAGGQALARLPEQVVAEERVQVVGRRRAVPAVDEQAPPVQGFQQACGLLAREGTRFRRRDRGRDGAAHQHEALRRGRALQDFAGEVGVHRVAPGRHGRLVRIGRERAAQVFAPQHECRRPAFGGFQDPFDLRRAGADPVEDRGRLLRRAGECRGFDARDALGGAEARELGRRLGPRDDDQRAPFGQLVQALGQRGSLLARRARVVEVVEHEHAVRGQQREQVAEERPREARELLLRLGRGTARRCRGACARAARPRAACSARRCPAPHRPDRSGTRGGARWRDASQPATSVVLP